MKNVLSTAIIACPYNCPHLIIKWNKSFSGVIYQRQKFYCINCHIYKINMWLSSNYDAKNLFISY